MHHGIYLAPFGELADPTILADLAASAEAAGFDGVFLWDHVARPHHPDLAIADPWTALAAIATRTRRIRLGPLVTPLARRRPSTLARQCVTLDRLSRGRLVLGVGLGSNTGDELTRLGEAPDVRTRAEMLDEALELVCALWSGEQVHHAGPHYTAAGVRFLPRPFQRPRIPIWVAARSVRAGPLRRAARFDGLCPETTPDGLVAMLEQIQAERGNLDGYDVAIHARPDEDPAPYEAAGATWWLTRLPEVTTAAAVASAIAQGPPVTTS